MKTIGINVGRSLATDLGVIARKRASYAAPSGSFGDGLTGACAFSLIEVVVAIGILAVTLIVVLGLLASGTRPAGEIASAILEDICEFRGAAPMHDDQTVIVLKVN